MPNKLNPGPVKGEIKRYSSFRKFFYSHHKQRSVLAAKRHSEKDWFTAQKSTKEYSKSNILLP